MLDTDGSDLSIFPAGDIQNILPPLQFRRIDNNSRLFFTASTFEKI